METESIELVKMSGKGQLVVPQDIREASHLNPGERFVAFPIDNGVLFKKVEIPAVKLEWRQLAKEVQANFKKHDIKTSDIAEAIKWSKKG